MKIPLVIMMEVLFWWSWFCYLSIASGSISEVYFIKSSVIPETFDVSLLYNITVRKKLECANLCERNLNCRSYMYCSDSVLSMVTCYLYLEGEHCVITQDKIQNKICSCFRKKKQYKNSKCYSPIGYYGNECQNIIQDCNDGKLKNFTGKSRSFIKPKDREFEVACDFDYGYTNIQVRRTDSLEVNFTRPMESYEEGFGNIHSEYWLGLANIHDLTFDKSYTLAIIIVTRESGGYCLVLYGDFKPQSLELNTLWSGSLHIDTCEDLSFYVGVEGRFITYNKSFGCDCPLSGGWWYDGNNHCNICNNLNQPRSDIFDHDITQVIMRLQPE